MLLIDVSHRRIEVNHDESMISKLKFLSLLDSWVFLVQNIQYTVRLYDCTPKFPPQLHYNLLNFINPIK